MEPVWENEGHAVLLASEVKIKTVKDLIAGEDIEIATFYTLSTTSDTDPGSYGGKQMTFKKIKGGWTRVNNDDYQVNKEYDYLFRGIGQLTGPNASASEKQEAKDLVEIIKTGEEAPSE